MALDRASDSNSTPAEIDSAIESVLKHAEKERDHYNAARAILRKARILVARKDRLSDADKTRLMRAYEFFFTERVKGSFDDCHDALWNIFEGANETANLFRLFRHSSLIWRLRGDDDREKRYLKRLARYAEALINSDFRSLDKEAAYYLVRAGNTLIVVHSNNAS